MPSPLFSDSNSVASCKSLLLCSVVWVVVAFGEEEGEVAFEEEGDQTEEGDETVLPVLPGVTVVPLLLLPVLPGVTVVPLLLRRLALSVLLRPLLLFLVPLLPLPCLPVVMGVEGVIPFTVS